MRILLTGGSACGKSTFAEQLAVRLPLPRYYIATMRPYDEECIRKIARHRKLRANKGFITLERHTAVEGLHLPERGTVLLECMCNLTANEMFDPSGNAQDVYGRILNGIDVLAGQCNDIIVVTNDVGSDCREFDGGTAQYIHELGRLNAALAARFDCVCELVCGIPIVLKGELP